MSKRVFTEEHRRKLSESHKGNKGYWNGKKFLPDHRLKLKESHKGLNNSPATQFKKGLTPWNKGLKNYNNDEENGMWKGSSVGYYALHAWINRKLGKPTQCSHCPSAKNIQWANKSREYKRAFSDWFQLCVPCHRKFDSSFADAKRLYISKVKLLNNSQ